MSPTRDDTATCHSLLIVWYSLHGHPTTDTAHRRASAPWYRSKTEPATLDMLTSLRPPEMCRAVESKQSMIVKVGARW